MPYQELENFLTILCTQLHLNESQKLAITQELTGHFDLKVKSLIDSELSRDEATKLALDEFGDVTSMASRFNEVNRTRYRNSIVRISSVFSVAAVAVTLIVFGVQSMFPKEAEMSFAFGPIELALVVVMSIATSILFYVGNAKWKGAATSVACLAVASVITPPDPASCGILGALFFLFVYAGVRLERSRLIQTS